MKTMATGVRIGGVDGPNGQLVLQVLRGALMEAIRRGQNDVAKSIAAEVGRLGATSNNVITGCNFQGIGA